MPWTLSHPAAVIPLYCFFRRYLAFTPLVVGSMTPDFGYYIQQFGLATFAHGFWGSVLVCLPLGFLLLAALCLVRRPIGFMLPQPHRAVFSPLIGAPVFVNSAAMLKTLISIFLGAWTHIVWDSFTHQNGWVVRHFSLLRQSVDIGTIHFPLYYLLQQMSTIVGVVILTIFYRRRFCAAKGTSIVILPFRNRLRYALWGISGLVAVLIAVPSAMQASAHVQGYLAVRVFIFKMALFATAVFVPLLVVCSILFYFLSFRTRCDMKLDS